MAFNIEKELASPSLKRFHGVDHDPVYYCMRLQKIITSMNDSGVRDHLQGKWVDFNREHGEIVEFKYRPNMPRFFPSGDDFGTNCFNLWEPTHQRYECNKIPNEIATFMEHLFPLEKSREYVYDWMANALQGRNFTYLTLVSGQGTGKGTFAEIFKHLVGAPNFAELTSDTIKSRFNGELINKHLVFIDEINVSLRDPDSVNRLKAYANSTISVEQKGLQRKTVDNMASYLLATNLEKGVPVEEGDRRFSIVDTTKIKVVDAPEIMELVVSNVLISKQVIEPLFNFLMGRRVDTKAMLRPYSGENKQKVMQSLLPDWIATIEQEFYGNTEVSLLQIQVALEEAGIKPPGRPTLARAFKMVQKKNKDGRYFFDITERLRDW